jgi:hypothetical protein
MYLNRYKRIVYFDRLYKSIGTTIYQRKVKINRIIKYRLHNYVNEFLKVMHDKKMNKIMDLKK